MYSYYSLLSNTPSCLFFFLSFYLSFCLSMYICLMFCFSVYFLFCQTATVSYFIFLSVCLKSNSLIHFLIGLRQNWKCPSTSFFSTRNTSEWFTIFTILFLLVVTFRYRSFPALVPLSDCTCVSGLDASLFFYGLIPYSGSRYITGCFAFFSSKPL